MNERREEFLRHRKAIEDLYKRKNEALYELYPEFRSPNSIAHFIPEIVPKFGQPVDVPMSEIIKTCILKKDVDFKSRDVLRWLQEENPNIKVNNRTNYRIFTTVHRMTKEGILEVIQSKHGKAKLVKKKYYGQKNG